MGDPGICLVAGNVHRSSVLWIHAGEEEMQILKVIFESKDSIVNIKISEINFKKLLQNKFHNNF
jgi:hypothetical protein